MPTIYRFLLLSFGVLALIGCDHRDAVSQPSKGCELIQWQRSLPPHSERTPEIYPPDLRDTVITIAGPSRRISLPEGFTISVFARIPGARNVVFSPDSVLYVATANAVYALPDHNNDGVPDSSMTVASGLTNSFGVGFYHGATYITDESGFYRLTDTNGDRISEQRQKLLTLSGGGNHRTRNFVIDTAAGVVYIQVGSISNDDEDNLSDSTRGTILTANIDGSNMHIFARGLRNAVGLDFDPRTGALWTNVNGSDNMFGSGTTRTDNNPSECVYIVCDGANYGWPYAYGYQMRNPKYISKDTSFIQSLSGPVAEVLAHEAPLGLHFYRRHEGAASNFPTKYTNAVFQSYHGSWDRSVAAPPRVTVMWIDSDGRNGTITDFINGFQVDSTASSRWGRTVGLTESPDGALYIADDQAGVVYKVAYTGTTQAVGNRGVVRGATIESIAPNPAAKKLIVSLLLPTARSLSYQVLDMLGRTAYAASTLPLGAGPQQLEVSLPELTPGTYILRIAEADAVLSKAFVVQ